MRLFFYTAILTLSKANPQTLDAVFTSIAKEHKHDTRTAKHFYYTDALSQPLFDERIMTSFPELLERRVSTSVFDTTRSLSENEILALIDQAVRAPSAYNMQNWSFLVVHSAAAKQRLLPIAYGQQKVADAAATIIISGLLDGHATFAQRFNPLIEQGQVHAEHVAQWANGASRTYSDNERRQRDEAIRSASLAGMTLMLAAQAQGLATGPMIGFDPEALAKEFALSAEEIPAIMITLGYPAETAAAQQKPRVPAAQICRFV